MDQTITKFTEKLRKETGALHILAERTGFNLSLFQGKMTKEGYAKFLIYKYQVYSALESAIEERKDVPAISKLSFPELTRKEYLLNNIKTILGDQWKEETMMDTTSSNIYRIEVVAKENPVLLLAHSYINYLADLSGGLIIKKMLQDKYGYSAKELTAYDFDIRDVNGFKENYKEILNEIVEEHGIEEQFIEEVKLSFIFSIAVLQELVL